MNNDEPTNLELWLGAATLAAILCLSWLLATIL